MEAKTDSRRRISGGKVSDFMAQFVIATVGAMLVGAVVVLIPAELLATFTRNSSGGKFADHLVEQGILILLSEPYFVAPILAGFTLGLFGRRIFRSGVTTWVWIVPTALLIGSIAT